MPALLAVVSIGVRAQDASTPSEEHVAAATVSVIVVEAERAELHDSGVYIRVPADALDAPSLPELLADLPGVQVRSAGGLGSYSEASLRGSSGRQVRVLLDGLPLDAGGGEASSLSLISPLMLESVEIYKGRVPVSLGSGLAGTINLRSRDRLPEPLIGAAGLGTLGQFHASAAAKLGAGVQLAAGMQGAENDFRYRNPFSAFDPADPDRRREVPRRNAGTAQTFGQLRLDGPLRVGAQLLDDRQELPTRLNASDTRTQLDTRVHGISLASPSDHA
jgi:outer membrane cobalamin receptor